MKNAKPGNIVKQFICYVMGLLVITIGINISKMSALGISPVSSIPRACEQIWGFTLGTTTFIIYIILVVLQIVILRKDFKIINVLGIVLTMVFSVMIECVRTFAAGFSKTGKLCDEAGLSSSQCLDYRYRRIPVPASKVGSNARRGTGRSDRSGFRKSIR